MNYAESKQKLNNIRQKYGCKGDIIFRTAIHYVVEHGQYNLRDETWFDEVINDIDDRHDMAENNNKILWVTRGFEKAIMECARELAFVDVNDLLIYIQREVWFYGGEIGEPDYQRALQIIRNCLCYTADRYGAYAEECSETLYKFREMELADEEIEYFGWEYLFDVENEED